MSGLPNSARVRPPRCAWLLLVLAFLVVQAAAAAELKIRETSRDYPIRAIDAVSLYQAFQQQRPVDSQAAESPALTQVAITSRLTIESDESGCVWTGPMIVLEMHTDLPDWENRAEGPPALQEEWLAIRAGLEEHEAGHRRIARESVQRLMEAIRQIDVAEYRRQPCREIQRKLGALQTRELARLSLKQQNYDERTRFGANQGAVLRLGRGGDRQCSRNARRARADCFASDSVNCLCEPDTRQILLHR